MRKNDSRRQHLRQLACRHKIGHASQSEEAFASKPDAVAEIIDLV